MDIEGCTVLLGCEGHGWNGDRWENLRYGCIDNDTKTRRDTCDDQEKIGSSTQFHDSRKKSLGSIKHTSNRLGRPKPFGIRQSNGLSMELLNGAEP